jgi:hypothetical protein
MPTHTDLTDMDLLTKVRTRIIAGLEYVVNIVSYRMSYQYFRRLINDLSLKLGIRVKIQSIKVLVNGVHKITKAKVIPL